MSLSHDHGPSSDAALLDIHALATWLAERDRYVVLDPDVDERLHLPAGRLPPSVVDGRSAAPLPELLADRRAVLLHGRSWTRRRDPDADVHATVETKPLWVTTHPRSYAGIRVTGTLGDTLFWRGAVDTDVEVDATIGYPNTDATVIRTTTGRRIDAPRLGWRPQEIGARWASRSALYAAYLRGLSRFSSVSSDVHDAPTLAQHLVEAGVRVESVWLNGEEWGAVPLAYAPRVRGTAPCTTASALPRPEPSQPQPDNTDRHRSP